MTSSEAMIHVPELRRPGSDTQPAASGLLPGLHVIQLHVLPGTKWPFLSGALKSQKLHSTGRMNQAFN